MVQILILAYPGCAGGAVATLGDLFATANALSAHRRDRGSEPLFRVRTASVDGGDVVCGSGQVLRTLPLSDTLEGNDIVLLPGMIVDSETGLLEALPKLSRLSKALRHMAETGSVTAGMCTSTFLLAQAGLLDDVPATTTWWLSEAFRKRYPHIELVSSRLVIDAGQVVTAAAGSSYLDLGLSLIGRFANKALASQCAAFFCLDGPRASQNVYTIPHYLQTRDPFLESADSWILKHIGSKIEMAALAAHLNVSTRTLLRRFLESSGKTPSEYVMHLRVEAAKHQFRTTRSSVAQIADKVGYTDEDAFRRAFKTCTSMTPAQYRRQHTISR